MKKYPGFILAVVLLAIASTSCTQNASGTTPAIAAAPEVRWKYETGG